MKKLVRISIFLLVLLLLGFGAYGTWGPELLALKRVEVAGNRHVGNDELVSKTGLRAGSNILGISTSRVVARLQTIPWIESARVERIVPSTVRITVKERTPVAQVASADKVFLADRSGIVLAEATDNVLIMIKDLPGVISPGIRLTMPSYSESLTILSDLSPEIRGIVKSVSAATIDHIILETSDGFEILYGAHELVQEKNFAIRAVIGQAKAEGYQLAKMDVRVPKRPAVTRAA